MEELCSLNYGLRAMLLTLFLVRATCIILAALSTGTIRLCLAIAAFTLEPTNAIIVELSVRKAVQIMKQHLKSKQSSKKHSMRTHDLAGVIDEDMTYSASCQLDEKR